MGNFPLMSDHQTTDSGSSKTTKQDKLNKHSNKHKIKPRHIIFQTTENQGGNPEISQNKIAYL